MNKLDFIGNTRVVEQLGCLIDSKRFPHALIIEGEHGLGKKTLARRLAGALVCRGDNKVSAGSAVKRSRGFILILLSILLRAAVIHFTLM